MPKYIIKNTSNHPAKEHKPGIGTFNIPGGASLTVEDKELADSLVQDSGGQLVLEQVIADPSKSETNGTSEVSE